MKPILKVWMPFLLIVMAYICHAQTATVSAPTPYTVVSQDLNSRTWQRTVYQRLPSGQIVTNVEGYTEAASGLNFLDANGQLQPSKEEVDVLQDGSGSAIYGQHQVYWPADIGNGTVKLIEPGGAQLLSQPLCLSYWDGSNYVEIAELTNSVGEIVSSNQVLYPQAFGTVASLLYSYTKAGLEQFVILNEQPPTPQSLGLNPDTTRLQAVTEFFDAPEPTVSASMVATSAGDTENDSLTFGTMSMVPGKAFMLGTAASSVGIERQWVTQNGRQILVEEVPVNSISDQLASLPRVSSRKFKSLKSSRYAASEKQLLPPQTHRRVSRGNRTRIARATAPGRGLILDYYMVNGSVTNYTFHGDNTYYISSTLDIFGTNNYLEGGAVIKFASGASVVVEGNPGSSIQTLTGADRPVIWTGKDDNTIGVEISGSTGNPVGYYANPALEISGTAGSPGILSNLRISYAQTGIEINGQSARFFNVQLMYCGTGCDVNNGEATFENALFGNVTNDFTVDSTSEAGATNVTFSDNFTLSTGSGDLSLGNCILASVTNSGSATLSACILTRPESML